MRLPGGAGQSRGIRQRPIRLRIEADHLERPAIGRLSSEPFNHLADPGSRADTEHQAELGVLCTGHLDPEVRALPVDTQNLSHARGGANLHDATVERSEPRVSGCGGPDRNPVLRTDIGMEGIHVDCKVIHTECQLPRLDRR